jgi:hypothetical protein
MELTNGEMRDIVSAGQQFYDFRTEYLAILKNLTKCKYSDEQMLLLQPFIKLYDKVVECDKFMADNFAPVEYRLVMSLHRDNQKGVQMGPTSLLKKRRNPNCPKCYTLPCICEIDGRKYVVKEGSDIVLHENSVFNIRPPLRARFMNE